MLARAVAGQAGVPFLHVAGSEFNKDQEDLNAWKVNNLFRAAKAKAPCVVFIDEIESVGPNRSFANKTKTINQLLSGLSIEIN